jgi:ABC-type dipeptide/oligopeptide/nickel transport system permease subunit
MTALLGPLDPVSEADAGPAPASEARLPTLLRRPAGVAAFVVLALIVAMAVFAPLLAPDDPVTQNLSVVSVRPRLSVPKK